MEALLRPLGLALGAAQEFLAFEFGGELHVPCQDAERRWTAVQKRTATGAKFYVRRPDEPAHCPALFVPLPIGDDPVLVVEGFSDACALASLGLTAIGRSTAKPGRFELDALRHYVRGRSVVVVGENDKKPDGRHPGAEGSWSTAVALALASPCVRVIFPPAEHKDARAAIRCGWSREDIEREIGGAEPIALRVREEVRA